MTKLERQRYARAVLLAQDKISIKYHRAIRAEIKRTAKDLSSSYVVDGQDGFNTIELDHKSRMNKILNDLAYETIVRFRKISPLGKKALFDNFVEQSIYDILSTSAAAMALSVANTTVATAVAVIANQMVLGKTDSVQSEPEMVAEAISKWIGGSNSLSRAMTIARTETHKAVNVSQYTRAEMSADIADLSVIVEWIATNDGRVRDGHRHADGQLREIGKPFLINGELMKHPSDPHASAANVINCRCVVGYDTVDAYTDLSKVGQ